ncbi:hypothetical protein HYDPIDRAFT_104361 [Hydnomerulius pinastri MD-312]|nr:hypothetical protein HYDPIDRAFT_104361 [Hydnomerulius pinastri MD-312]
MPWKCREDFKSEISLRQELHDAFRTHVFSTMPTRLLDIRDPMKPRVVDREAVYNMMKGNLEKVPLDFIEKTIIPAATNRGGTSIPGARSLIIQSFLGSIAGYAIFSHRWLAVGEIALHDLTNPSGLLDGPGWEKLLHFCRKASELGCLLAWADTCCIDKSSSAELDEAIRSMFRWYRLARVCVVHLADTTSLTDIEHDVWFTRGWTLQELLAPQRLKFYSKGWDPLTTELNDKEDAGITQSIERATGISVNDLLQFEPGTRNVALRMSWAAGRMTTRVEDRAYSLIGIFDVTMIIAYGEGEKAFRRLMEAIYQSCEHWEIFLWEGRCCPHPVTNALPASPECYLPYGRDDVGLKAALSKSMLYSWRGHDVERTRVTRGDTDFALTNHGLRIKCLILPITLSSPTQIGDDLWRWTLCPSLKDLRAAENKGEIVEDVAVLVDHETARYVGKINHELAIGVLDYANHFPGIAEGTVGGLFRGHQHVGWLLARDSVRPEAQFFKLMTYNLVKMQLTGPRHIISGVETTVLQGQLQTLQL